VKRTKSDWLTSIATLAFFVGCVSWATAGSLFKDPIISVSPRTLNFGASKTSVTNSIVVENWGGGKLVGKATVPRPFKILSGGTYRLGPADVQIVTISYTPGEAAFDTNVVVLTGGGGTIVSVTGRSAKTNKDK
jgi:hypothetical protein